MLHLLFPLDKNQQHNYNKNKYIRCLLQLHSVQKITIHRQVRKERGTAV